MHHHFLCMCKLDAITLVARDHSSSAFAMLEPPATTELNETKGGTRMSRPAGTECRTRHSVSFSGSQACPTPSAIQSSISVSNIYTGFSISALRDRLHIHRFLMSTPMDVDPKGGAARDDRKTFNSRVIQAIDDYSTANGLVFGGFATPPKLLQILLSTHLPTGTNAPDEAACGEYISVTPNLFPKLLKAYRDNSFFELLNDVDMRPLTGLTDYQSGGLPTSRSVRGKRLLSFSSA
ncbi:uncharacterized protein EI90DRAFT_769458 [Cantharellus anzutake]|uniref:uncharacterized protein n=1 Tax=Cantharellus anzutake TaxID=1750568 RepID=UPI001903CB5A|nr:uncharacterized protein EI90DRAFT_769458 [Cantharellus anzutake]KAF8342622.1 hypothetical protein EI90DRAFT_769458 [Cantharellus anzutake]